MRASLWSKEVSHVGDIHAKVVDCSFLMLFSAITILRVRHPAFEVAGSTGRCGGAVRIGGFMLDSVALQFCVSVPVAEVLAKPAEDRSHRLGFFGGVCDSRVH